MAGLRIGIFGGTFDPPHLGHLILAEEARDQLRLERLLWVLTPDPPHKQGQAVSAVSPRLELVQAAIGDNPAFELSRVDLDRPGPHYALDTVLRLQKQFPGADLVYLIGGDSLHDLPTWHCPRELLAACAALGVMRRPEDRINLGRLEREIPGISAKLEWIDAPLLEISSHEIRRRVAEGRPFRYYLPEKVYHLILAGGLYHTEDPEGF
ncbi:MAG TPA: nicotinate-nucleotide adenylyltransferase [Anaerolineaceae bacterium]|nr:nicotinate-nucleotide adenylyltransferase [Anaerolineaceae bacterium]